MKERPYNEESVSSGLISLLAVLCGFSLLIIWHELGHLLAAVSIGVKVDVFSIGFGQRLLGFKLFGIDFRISAIPFGGYVRFSNEGEGGLPREFFSRPLWQRIWVVLAGPLFSFILGPILIAVALAIGGQVSIMTNRIWRSHVKEFESGDLVVSLNGKKVSGERFLNLISQKGKKEVKVLRGGKEIVIFVDRAVPIDSLEMLIPPVIGDVRKGFPAYSAGLKAGDTVLYVDTLRIETWQQIAGYVQNKREGDSVLLTIKREGKELRLKVGVKEEDGVGRLGIMVAYRKYPMPVGDIFKETGRLTVRFSALLADVLKKMVKGQVKVEETVGGPITIGAAMASTAHQGMDRYFLLLALITLQLAVINLFPIPGLDGGHILFFLVDEIYYRFRRKRVPERAQFWILIAGFSILATLAVLVLGLDVIKLLTGRLLPH